MKDREAAASGQTGCQHQSLRERHLLEVQRLLRHKRLETTRRYVDERRLDLRDAAELVHFFPPGTEDEKSETERTDSDDGEEARPIASVTR